MNKFSAHLIVTLGVASFGVSGAAMADAPTPVTATATIDWSHLQLSVSGVAGAIPTVEFSNYNTSLNSFSSTADESKNHTASANNWTTSKQVEADNGTSLAHGFASSAGFSGTSTATEAGSSANSSGSRSVNFSFDGPGVFTASVPYTISLTGSDSSCCPFDTASVSGNASFSNFTGGGSWSSNSDVSYSLGTFGDTSTFKTGNLVFGIVAGDAGTGSLAIGFNLSTAGVVPEPQTYAMFLAGLGIIGAVIRGRNKRVGIKHA